MRHVWLVFVACAALPAHADDDGEDDGAAPKLTRRWHAEASIDEVRGHTSKSGNETTTWRTEAHGAVTATLGTTDDDVSGTAWVWAHVVGKPTASGTMVSEMTVVNDGHTYVTRFEGTADPTTAAISCKYEGRAWTCSAGMHYAGTETSIVDGKVVTTKRDTKAQAALFGGGTFGLYANTRTGSVARHGERFTFHNDIAATDLHQTTTIKIAPLDRVGFEAVFVVDAEYEHWIPEGPPLRQPHAAGNTLDVHVELRDAATHKPVQKVFSTKLALDASRLPGTCGNFPAYGEPAPDEPDLYFDAAHNRSGTVVDPTHLELAQGKGGAKVTITSRDYGAFATLSGHVRVADGTELDVTMPDGGGGLAIPKDDNANRIADWWETQQGIHGGRQSDTDDEGLPHGMKVDGDGYTLFEEYRGFVQADPTDPLTVGRLPRPQHVRLAPNKRDLFVGLAVGDAKDEAVILSGLRAFADMNTVELHFVAGSRFMGPLAGDYNDSMRRRVDLRSDTPVELFGKPQSAVWIATGIPSTNDSPAFAWNLRGDGDMSKKAGDLNESTGAFGSPSDVKMILVSRKNARDTADGMRCFLDPDCKITHPRKTEYDEGLQSKLTDAERRSRAKWAKDHLDLLAERMMYFTIIHELGHTLGAYHHGRISRDESKGPNFCPMRYWQTSKDWDAILAYLDGSWDLTKSQDGTPWQWCSENLPQMRFRDFEN